MHNLLADFVLLSTSSTKTGCSPPSDSESKPRTKTKTPSIFIFILKYLNLLFPLLFLLLCKTIFTSNYSSKPSKVQQTPATDMCRSTDYHGLRFNDSDRLKIRSFFVRFSGLRSRKLLPESLTLRYLPRINENALEVDGSKIRPDSQAFVSLYRSVNAKTNGDGEVVFGSRERVRASEGVRFEVYFKEEKVLKGIFRKDEDEEWKLDCKCALESEMVGVRVSEAEVCVAVEGDVAMRESVAMVVKRKRNGRRGFSGLEEIPEEREVDDDESDGCDCSCGETEIGFDGADLQKDSDGELVQMMDMEGVRWAVDVGIWVMCLGVGFLVSKASAKTLRRKRIL